MTVLAIDSSTQALVLAVTEDQHIIAERTIKLEKNHSIKLMPAISSILEDLQLKPNQLEAIAVTVGPGSYTGIRIGVTTAKMLAYSLNIPLFQLSSLHILCYQVISSDYRIFPFIDAKRGNIYLGEYHWQDRHYVPVQQDRLVSLATWLEQQQAITEKMVWISQDIEIHLPLLRSMLGENTLYLSSAFGMPRLALAMTQLIKHLEPISPHDLLPNYLQLAEAEQKFIAQREFLQS
jgi:tRNA threonylcarbamoyladenosine biosynthesis protein TsaB